MRKILAITGGFAVLALCGAAHATMPTLTPTPKPPTATICEKCASIQDDDAIDMWGIQNDGTTSRAVALRRLADSCMGRRVPAIVGFGSSVGFDDMYCEKHATLKLCKDVNMK